MTMKLAFSTLGCPEWTWTEIYSMARDLGYSGIEIRGLGEEITAYPNAAIVIEDYKFAYAIQEKEFAETYNV